MKDIVTVILAAGQGTRMKSDKPKVLHEICSKPMIRYILDMVYGLKIKKNILIVGHHGELVRDKVLSCYPGLECIKQHEQLGSGHALLQAKKELVGYKGDIMVVCGDTPLLSSQTIKKLVSFHKQKCCAATILTAHFENPTGYGRIIRGEDAGVYGIVEHKDANEKEKLITEINTGTYCFDNKYLFNCLKKIKCNNVKKEYYLTDVIKILIDMGLNVQALPVSDTSEVVGINNRVHLAMAESVIQKRILNELMMGGVSIKDPSNTYISSDTKIGRDTYIYPGTIIEGKTIIGNNCYVGPNSFIKDSTIGKNVTIRASFIYSARIGDDVKIGPYSHIRPDTVLAQNSRVGNFVEIKKSRIGKGSKISHLTYIGDTHMADNVNIGAGVITCNYDGISKNRTTIGDDSFIGSNVNLVAPVKIGKGAIIGAGSTINKNVPAYALALARSRQLNKHGYVKKLRKARK